MVLIANSILNKGKYAVPPLLNEPEVLWSTSGKAKLFAKMRTLLILMTHISLYLLSILELL